MAAIQRAPACILFNAIKKTVGARLPAAIVAASGVDLLKRKGTTSTCCSSGSRPPSLISAVTIAERTSTLFSQLRRRQRFWSSARESTKRCCYTCTRIIDFVCFMYYCSKCSVSACTRPFSYLLRYPMFALMPLDSSKSTQLIQSSLFLYRKTLTTDQMQGVLSKHMSDNALYVRLFCEVRRRQVFLVLGGDVPHGDSLFVKL